MATKIYNKTILQTSFTSLESIYYLLQTVKKNQPITHLQGTDEVFPQARARISQARGGEWDEEKRDTHAELTLKEMMLIRYNNDETFEVSDLGNAFLAAFNLIEEPVENGKFVISLQDNLTLQQRNQLLLDILLRIVVEQPKYNRSIHPYLILFKLLTDTKLDGYISKSEWACFINNSAYILDSQYAEIRDRLVDVRNNKEQQDAQKSDRILTRLVLWNVLDKIESKIDGIKQSFFCLNENFAETLSYYLLQGDIYKHSTIKAKINVQNNPKKHEKNITDLYRFYLTALRTKPFMLLAGISGTGKSRIVREFAFKSCPPALQDAEGTTPGNYCMIEVKPNWHDSTEILGYYSNISKKYHFTKFVKFLVKAMMFPDVPFFVCLDEMNLAPVEQYFAEFLSVLETRKKDKETEIIQSGVLVAPEYFAPILNADSGNGYIAKYLCPEINVYIPNHIYTSKSLTTIGLTLPDNVFIIGTVNMDDTTHQFSRKVIDRAMTIEMNGGKLEDMFGHSADLQYLPEDQIMELSDFKPEYVNADEVMEAHSEYAETLQEKLVEKLDAINNCLKNTPFQVSYRVLNELCIYAGVLLDDGKEIDTAIADAIDQITLMKILPRIEGDEDMFVTKDGNKLEQLQEILGKDSASGVKLEEMKERLKNSSFTRFWP